MGRDSKLISDAYRAEQKKLHENPDYGVASIMYAPLVIAALNGTAAKEMLDYGAGKGRLAEQVNRVLGARAPLVHEYEPSDQEKAAVPAPCEFVACIDVLEHVEPECLDAVLDDLQRVVAKSGLFTVHTGPAQKALSDGRNAHLIQEDAEWWLRKLLPRFELIHFTRLTNGFWVGVKKKK